MHPQVRDWLLRVITPYANPDLLLQEVEILLQRYVTLKPKTDYFQSKLLLKLYGVLPIQYQGNTYNIPIEIWIPLEYPKQSAIVKVVPTETMILNGSKCDAQGYVKVDHIKSLIKICEYLIEQFSIEPPVVSKAQFTQGNGISTLPNVIGQSNSPHSTPPPIPLKIQSYKGSITSSNPNSTPPAANSIGITGLNNNLSPPRNLPFAKYQSGPNIQGYSTSPPNRYPTGNGTSPIPPMQIPYHSSPPMPQTFNPSSSVSPPQTFVPSYASSYVLPKPTIDPRIEQSIQNRQKLYEKLIRKVKQFSESAPKETDRLIMMSAQLSRKTTYFVDAKQHLEHIKQTLERNNIILEQKIKEAEQNVDGIRSKIINLDLDIKPKTELEEQLFETTAQMYAMEDLLYYLSRKVSKESDLDTYIKNVRHIGREMFMKRALIMKIQGMNPV